MKMKKMLSMLLAGAMLVGLLAACGGDKPSGEETKKPAESQNTERTEPYRIGSIGLGGDTMTAAALSIRSICDAAGVEYVTAEMSGYDDQGFLTTYENLINMGVDSVILYTFSEGTIRLLADLCTENEVNFFVTNRQVSDPDLKAYLADNPYYVGNDFCEEEQNAYDMVKQLHDEHGVKNLAVIGLAQGDTQGDKRDKGIARACKDLGINLLTETRGIADVTDVTNAVEGIISSYPELDGLFIVGGVVTKGALAGANQALVNHNMQDKVAIGMIDIAAGMEEYMGEGKPLKVVAGGNLVFDNVLAAACLINHKDGVNADKVPYIINTRMMFIENPQDSVDYSEYYENPNKAMMSGDQWYDTLLGKSLEEMQAFVDNFTIAYAKSMNQ